MGGKSVAKYKLCRCRYRCEIKNLMREEWGLRVSYILHALLPSLLTPLWLQDPFGPFFFPVCSPPLPRNCQYLPTLLWSGLCFLAIVSNALTPYPLSATCYPLYKLSHCWILALGLIERPKKESRYEARESENTRLGKRRHGARRRATIWGKEKPQYKTEGRATIRSQESNNTGPRKATIRGQRKSEDMGSRKATIRA